MLGLCYDSAPNMQSEKKGVASFILKGWEKVVVTHYCIHNVYLSISAWERIQLIGKVIEWYKITNFFFKSSLKKETISFEKKYAEGGNYKTKQEATSSLVKCNYFF